MTSFIVGDGSPKRNNSGKDEDDENEQNNKTEASQGAQPSPDDAVDEKFEEESKPIWLPLHPTKSVRVAPCSITYSIGDNIGVMCLYCVCVCVSAIQGREGDISWPGYMGDMEMLCWMRHHDPDTLRRLLNDKKAGRPERIVPPPPPEPDTRPKGGPWVPSRGSKTGPDSLFTPSFPSMSSK